MDHVALTLDGSIDHAGPAGAMRWAPPPQVATARQGDRQQVSLTLDNDQGVPPSAPQPAEPTPPAPTATHAPAESISAVRSGPTRPWWERIAQRMAAR